MTLVNECKILGRIIFSSIIALIIFASPIFAGDKNDVLSNNTAGGNENGGIIAGSGTEQVTDCGDMNNDGVVDILDIDFFIEYYFLFGPAPVVTGVGDTNCDGVTDISDLVNIAEYLAGTTTICCDGNGEPGKDLKEWSPKDKLQNQSDR